MPFCSKCGQAYSEGVKFCPACGAPVGEPGGANLPVAANAPGMAENVTGALCYVLGWLTGIVFFLVDKRPFVRFHSAQSMVAFVGLTVLHYVISAFFGATLFSGGILALGPGLLLLRLVDLATLVVWILCIVKAYSGQRYKLPLAGDWAEKIFGV
jgi:uncharacterized membrane protein